MPKRYIPNAQSANRVKFAFRVDFTNGGYVEGKDFLLDIEGDDVSDDDLKELLVDAMNLAKAGPVTLFAKEIVPRCAHNNG